MNKILFTLAAITVVSIGFASQAQAAPRGHFSHTSHGRFANYHLNYGTRFAHGFYYTGRHHNHWSFVRYDARYRCNCYYDPYCSAWYYWCAPANCYYPVSYCPYNTYCWGSGGCGSFHAPSISILPRTVQVPVAPVAPVAPALNGPVAPALNGPAAPVGPSVNGPVAPAGPITAVPTAPSVPAPSGPAPISPMVAPAAPVAPMTPAVSGPQA